MIFILNRQLDPNDMCEKQDALGGYSIQDCLTWGYDPRREASYTRPEEYIKKADEARDRYFSPLKYSDYDNSYNEEQAEKEAILEKYRKQLESEKSYEELRIMSIESAISYRLDVIDDMRVEALLSKWEKGNSNLIFDYWNTVEYTERKKIIKDAYVKNIKNSSNKFDAKIKTKSVVFKPSYDTDWSKVNLPTDYVTVFDGISSSTPDIFVNIEDKNYRGFTDPALPNIIKNWSNLFDNRFICVENYYKYLPNKENVNKETLASHLKKSVDSGKLHCPYKREQLILDHIQTVIILTDLSHQDKIKRVEEFIIDRLVSVQQEWPFLIDQYLTQQEAKETIIKMYGYRDRDNNWRLNDLSFENARMTWEENVGHIEAGNKTMAKAYYNALPASVVINIDKMLEIMKLVMADKKSYSILKSKETVQQEFEIIQKAIVENPYIDNEDGIIPMFIKTIDSYKIKYPVSIDDERTKKVAYTYIFKLISLIENLKDRHYQHVNDELAKKCKSFLDGRSKFDEVDMIYCMTLKDSKVSNKIIEKIEHFADQGVITLSEKYSKSSNKLMYIIGVSRGHRRDYWGKEAEVREINVALLIGVAFFAFILIFSLISGAKWY